MVNVKICGITRIEDALLAKELGAWAIGFIFYPPSLRYISPEKASEISKKLENSGTKKVGVFVNEKPETINEIAETVGLDYVQLHGHETIEECTELNLPYIKTIRNINEIEIYNNAFAFLVDAVDTENWGGTGKLADWELAKTIKNTIKGDKPLILSGGLSSDNIREALLAVNPDFVDISSSVESEQGIKNHSKLTEFFKEANINDI